jgi:CheY-like chemotaxis protein
MTMKRILVIDDEEGMRDVFYRLLSSEGYIVETARDGNEGLDKVKKRQFDLSFIDVRMPELNGLETFLQIKKLQPGIKAFLISGYAVDSLVEKAVQEGALGCIRKPSGIRDVVRVAKKIVG